MTEEAYAATQARLMTIAILAHDLPLTEFVTAAAAANATGAGHLTRAIRLASALHAFQFEVRRQAGEFGVSEAALLRPHCIRTE